MEIYVSINGVLRNLIQKIEYHYENYYLNSTPEDEFSDNFEYLVNKPIYNDKLLEHFNFHSQQEFENFLFIEFPVEIFGHAGISYPHVISDLNKFIYENKDHNVTLIGIDELGKAKPSTLFFLSKNACLMNTIKFIRTENIEKEWENCDIWVTDNRHIIDKCPINKQTIKFNTDYNGHFNTKIEINKLTEISQIWKT